MKTLDMPAAAPANTRAAVSALAKPPIFTFVLVKLASRCNINCTYCYWFRDPEVYNKPPVLTLEAEDAFCSRLEQHIREFRLDQFLLVFHGGEPLLFPSVASSTFRRNYSTSRAARTVVSHAA